MKIFEIKLLGKRNGLITSCLAEYNDDKTIENVKRFTEQLIKKFPKAHSYTIRELQEGEQK